MLQVKSNTFKVLGPNSKFPAQEALYDCVM